jgi:putative membrane protein
LIARLAHDRTLLAWVRTATSLITFQQFFRKARFGAPESTGIIGPHGFGLAMIIIGVVALVLGTLDHRWRMLALQARYPAKEPHRSWASLLAALVALLGLLVWSHCYCVIDPDPMRGIFTSRACVMSHCNPTPPFLLWSSIASSTLP